MTVLATAVLTVFVVGYLVLAGSDIGVGMMLRRWGRTERERRLVIAGFAPFFLGNEVWLVAAVGVLAGAFPRGEHQLLESLFPLVWALVLAWIVRDAGLWLRGRADAARWRAGCDAAVTAGSWGLAVTWGSLLGTLLHASLTGAGITGFNAGSVWGVALAGLFAVHGAGFARWRLAGAPLERASRMRARWWVSGAALAGLAVAAGAGLPWSDWATGGQSLALTAVMATSLMPLLLGAQALVWWTFRGRVEGPSYL